MKTPLTSSTRFILPRGVSGAEPANADAGTLSFDAILDKFRIKLSSGWSDVGGSGAPTGPAGGDLGGTYPNPTVSAIHSGATQLTIGTINTGEFLKLTGTVIGSAPAGTGTITGVTAGTGLTGGGTSGTVTLAVAYGLTAGTAVQGNDASVTNARDPVIHAQTLKSSPVGADEVVIADSAASFGLKKATLTSLSGLFSSGVSSFNSRTGAVVPTSGDYNATQVGLGNVTNDAQLKRAASDFSSFSSKSTPVGADVLLIEDSAASGAKKSITISGISITTLGYNPLTDLSPEFLWRANSASNTLSGGRYTTLAALGSDTTTFGTIGTQAPLQGTDGDGNVYVQFDGTAGVATAMQQSGVASNFTFLHDGTTSYTLAIIHDSPGGLSSGGVEQIIDNSGDTSANNGISFKNRDDTTGFHGPFYGVAGGSSGQYVHMVNGAQDFNSGFVRRKELTIIRYFRGQHRAAISGVTDTFVDIALYRNGVMTCFSVQNASYASGTPSFKLTLGENANSLANHWNGRLYELMIIKRPLSDRQLNNLHLYANLTYKVVC